MKEKQSILCKLHFYFMPFSIKSNLLLFGGHTQQYLGPTSGLLAVGGNDALLKVNGEPGRLSLKRSSFIC